jgi:hypothetical protein
MPIQFAQHETRPAAVLKAPVERQTEPSAGGSAAIPMRNAVPSAAATVIITIAVPPVMTTAGAPTLARNKCAGACSDQSTDRCAATAPG